MTQHDSIRAERAVSAASSLYGSPKDEMEALLDALAGLQSTDDPSLVPLHNQLMKRYNELEKLAKNNDLIF